ncbi:alcohol dehydrogenase [Aspergillus eucalypticola CBS 122712]|uniref:Alcohol dehydrogenase n=1 Tax=Aspergillus eucalypticola (strain CBS 122712 / IBT 29274) TaxID=1448314 RepID=A0A317VWY7_ASPEC|nr:alcohol dehydrogenase [Aspergillus eucalypticola CBS 122712]PWY78813.1 alcohol dehydrogenase [Aspergillus eucalypticola CBS 122712]
MPTHLAAILPSKSDPLTLTTRPTPTPGPNDLLIAVKSIALNPADTIMRDTGLFIPSYPTVIGFDLSGLVLEVGTNVPKYFHPGNTRIAAYSASVWKGCDPDYGAFQEKCLVPWQHVIPLPDEGVMISWNEAAMLPVAVQVALNAWEMMGLQLVADRKTNNETDGQTGKKREVLLVWGASSSVGSMGVQVARVLRDQPGSSFAAVYATSGAANHAYVRSLGANRVFDHRDPRVVDEIVKTASEDGCVIRYCFLAVGDVQICQAVVGAFVGDVDGDGDVKAKIASAPVVPSDVEVVDGVEVIFVMPAMDDEAKRLDQFRYWMGTWARENLANGNIRPSPELRAVGSGLQAVNDGLDELSRGVSCTKLIVEVAE